MAQAFNLTAQINLRAPGNLKPVVDTIKRELGSVTADVKVKVDPKSAKSVDAVTRKLQTMNSILVTSTKNTNNLNASLQALSASLSRTSSSTTKINTSLKTTGTTAAKAAKDLQLASTQMEEFGRQSFLAIKRFAAFSIVTTGIYGLINSVNSGLKAFINFDKEMIRLQQVTGKGALGLKSLEKEIRILAVSLGVSSEKLINVTTTLAQAGLSAEDTRVALQALAKTDLAPSFEDMTETTEGAIAAMRQFGIAAQDLERSLGSINAVAAAFAVEASDIITAIQRTGGVFASASKGVSQGSDALNEFIAIFTSVRATTRESAETIATGLRTILTRVQRSKTIDELKKFGVVLRDLEGKFVGPYESVKRLSQALNQLDPRSAEFAGIIEELGGFRQIGKVIPLIQQFATAQEALKVAQKGQNSLAEAATLAQKSLAVQLVKVKEQFLELISAVGKSQTFQLFLKTVLSLTSGLISLASAFKPILPFLAILGTIKGISAATQFASGFAGAITKGGGAKGAGAGIGSSITGTTQKDKSQATAKAAQATLANTTALDKLTSSIGSLDTTINSLITSVNANTTALNSSGGGTTLNGGGKVLGFARGGVVPGSGNRDTVPAMLQPGEFVIRKKAVETIGTDQLQGINKYASGGIVQKFQNAGEVEELSKAKRQLIERVKALGGPRSAASLAFENRPELSERFIPKQINDLLKANSIQSKNLQELKDAEEYVKFAELSKAGKAANQARIKAEKTAVEQSGQILQFGLAGLRYGTTAKGQYTAEVAPPSFTGLEAIRSTKDKIPIKIVSGTVTNDKDFAENIEKSIYENFYKSVEQAAESLGSKIGTGVDFDRDEIEKRVQNVGISSVIGAAVEGAISLLGAPFFAKDEKNKSIDFPRGLGPVADLFSPKIPNNIPTDVTRTIGNPGKSIPDYIEQIERYLQTERGQKINLPPAVNFANGGFIKKFAYGGVAESDEETRKYWEAMDAARQRIKDRERAEQDKAKGKSYGRISLRKDASNITATYMKDGYDRDGFVTAKKYADNLYTIGLSRATKGYGPRLYDVVMEAATSEGSMLTSDRELVSGSAKSVWDFYFKNRSDVRKTPLDPKYWTKNSSLIDPKLYGKPETWPPKTDPAWTLQTGYSKSADLINSPEVVDGNKIKQNSAAMALQFFQSGASRFANGGAAQDTVPALLTPGEFVINKKAASKIGYSSLNRLNNADKIQGYNKGGYVGVRKFALGGLAPDQQELVRYQAGNANVSAEKYIKELRSLVFSAFKDIKNVAPKQKELRAYSIQAKEKIRGIKASGADPAEQAKQMQGIKEAIIAQIQSIDPKMAATELEKRASELMTGLESGLNLDDIISSTTELSDVFNRTVLDQDAYREALVLLSEQTGLTLNSMEELVSGLDIQRDQLSESMGEQYGKFGELFPRLAESFGNTGFGSRLNNIASALDGNNIAKAIGDRLSFLGPEISEGIAGQLGSLFSVPGGIPALLGGLATTLGSVAQNFAGDDPYAQAAAGALTTGGAYAANGAILGQFFGPPGALAGAIIGGFVGILEGASDAFQRTALENQLEKISKSSADLDEAFVKLRENLTFESLSEAEKALGDFVVQSQGLRSISESTLGFGAYLPTWLGGTPSDVQQEALGAEISGMTKLADSIAEFAENRLRTLNDAEVDRRVSFGQNASVDEIYNTSIAVDELARSMLKAQGAIIGDVESLNDYANRAGAANAATIESIRSRAAEQAAIAAYISKRKQEGATENQINEALANSRAEAIARGKELIVEEEKERAKREQLARAIKQVTLQQEKLLDVYSRMGGALDKLLLQMDENIRQTDAYTDSLSGNAKVAGPNRLEEDILKNSSRYSMAEVQASAGRVSNLLGGGQAAQDVTGSVVAAKVLRDQLPALLRENEGRGADDAIAALEQQFQDLGLGGSEAITEALSEIEKELQNQEGGIISSEVTGKEIVEKLSQTLEAGAEASLRVLETFNEGVAKANEELNKYNEALSKADDYFRKANSIRINSELELQRALGKNVSFQDRNQAFTQEIESLTRNIVPGGTTDPRLIGEFIRAESERRRQDLAANSGQLPGAGGTDAAVKSAKELALRQAESARNINDANQALQRLADSGEVAASALDELQQHQRLAGASTDYLQRVMTSSSDELREMNKDLNAYSATMSGTATKADYNSLDFRQRSYRGFESVKSLMPDNIAQQMQARMTRQMLEQTNPQLLNQTAYIGPDGKPVSIDSALQQSETGVSPDTQYLVDAYKAASMQQIEANNQLGMNQLQSAQAHYAQMETLFAQLNTNLSNLMADIRSQVQADAAALQRPGSEQPDFGVPQGPGSVSPIPLSEDTAGGGGYAATGLGLLTAGAIATARRRRAVGPPGSNTTTVGGLVRRKIGEGFQNFRTGVTRPNAPTFGSRSMQLGQRVGRFGEMTREYGRAVSATPLGQKVGGFGRNVREVAAGGMSYGRRYLQSTRMPKMPKVGGKAGKYAGYGAAALAAGYGLYNAFSGGDDSGSQGGMNDLSIADGAINVQTAIINVGGNTELFGDVALDETMAQPAPGVDMGLAGLPLDIAAYSASQKIATQTFGQTAMNAGTKGLGMKGSIVGGLALAGIDMGVEAAGGREAVFGKEGAQVYGSAQNLGGAALTANPALNAINVGVDAFRTTGELLYDFNGKVEGYRAEGEQLLADMETKTAMVGETGAYLWQATDEAAKAFQRPVDSSVKLAVAIYDLSEASAESAAQMQKTSAMFADMQKNKFVYDEQTGEVSKVARSEDDAFTRITDQKVIDAQQQARGELLLENLTNAQQQGMSYADFAKGEGLGDTPHWLTNDTDAYAHLRKLTEEDIATKQSRSGTTEIRTGGRNRNKRTSTALDQNYVAAVEQEKARLREIKAQPQSVDIATTPADTTTAMQETATEAAVVADTPVSASTEVSTTPLSDMSDSLQESTDAEFGMIDALILNTESLQLLTNNIGMLMSMGGIGGGGIVPQLPNIPLPSNLPTSVDPNLLAQSAYNPATAAALQDVPLPTPKPIPVPETDYNQQLQEVMKEASEKGYASRTFDLSPQKAKTAPSVDKQPTKADVGFAGNVTPYGSLMPKSNPIVSDKTTSTGSSELTNILGNFSVSIPQFVNSIGMFDNAVNVFSKLFNNSSNNNGQSNENNNLSLDSKSIQAIEGFSVSVAAFGSYVTSLARLSLPSKVEIIGKYTFDVNISGAAAFEEMKVDLTKDLTELFGQQIAELNKELYDKSGGQLGKVTPSTTNVRNK